MRLAVLTQAALDGVAPDDVPLVEALAAAGARAEPVVWTQATAQALQAYDAVLMRSTWDWQHHRARFRAFLAELERLPVPVLNPAPLLRRFADKVYFRELWAAGVATVPTELLAASEVAARVPDLMRARGWREAVLKPSFTANATGAVRLGGDAATIADAARRAAASDVDGGWMLQPFLSEVQTEGEQSLVFIDGRFSHAVLKRPKPGDFRVQAEHGGGAVAHAPSAEVLASAARTVARAVPDAVFARVDGVVHGGELLLMELEVVEPELFLRSAPAAASTLAAAIVRRVTQWKRNSVPPS